MGDTIFCEGSSPSFFTTISVFMVESLFSKFILHMLKKLSLFDAFDMLLHPSCLSKGGT